MDTPMLNVYADELVHIAFLDSPVTPAEKVNRLESMGEHIGTLITKSWQDETQYLARGLRAATFLACLPSLKAIARDESHTQTTAAEVSANFQNLSSTILGHPALRPSAIREQAGQKILEKATGQLSEIGILGVLWWGIAHGLRDEKAYALPATRKQDSGFQRKDGLSLATDIVVHEDARRRLPIQVKTSPRENRYHPDIAFVVLSHVMGEEGPGNSRQILALLSRCDNRQLGAIHSRLPIRARQARFAPALTTPQPNPVRAVRR